MINDFLQHDLKNIDELIQKFCAYASTILTAPDPRLAGVKMNTNGLPHIKNIDQGVGAEMSLLQFIDEIGSRMNGSTGPNYYGFVTGGVTPAALLGDWLVALFDQNVMGSKETIAPEVEIQALNMLIDLLGLGDHYNGSFVTGATISNFVGLSTAKQWYGKKFGVDVAEEGLCALKPIPLFSAAPHSSIYKSLSMAGLGRKCLTLVPTINAREAIDLNELEALLVNLNSPSIVVANAGTVNTVDFDDLDGIGKLKEKYDFWLHVDAAFGGVVGCSESHKHLINGIHYADSITIDAHKWLNIPYDCAIQLTKNISLQREVFMNSASYLSNSFEPSNFVHLTPENSRRFRALPVWMSILAYGKNGYQEMIDRNVECAKTFGQMIALDPDFTLLADVFLNGVCFTLEGKVGAQSLESRVNQLLDDLLEDGRIFLTGTYYKGVPAMRLNVCNWQTTVEDMHKSYSILKELLASSS